MTAQRIRSAAAVTERYERWMKARLPFVIEKHLDYKHKRMAGRGAAGAPGSGPVAFSFLRATFYLWGLRVQENVGDLLTGNVPRVLGVGDVHLENFGTWRDAEGRLVWGANDIDEASRMPYTNDLVRLATSALLAGLAVDDETVIDSVTDGYRHGLRKGPVPFVLAERNQRLAQLTSTPGVDTSEWWDDKLADLENLPDRPKEVVRRAVKMLRRSFPDKEVDGISVGFRQAGLGSLGRPRILALGEWRGSRVCREAKWLLPSAWDWSHGHTRGSHNPGALLTSPYRATDPYAKVVNHWSVRRLAPDSDKIEIADIKAGDQGLLLHSMGRELANIHVYSTRARVLLDHLPRDPSWLLTSARVMADVVRDDQKQFARAFG